MKGQVLCLGRAGGESTGNREVTMKEDRQDRVQRVSIKKYCKPPLLCHVASSIAHIFNCFLTEPEAYKRKVDSEEEEEDEEDEEEQVVVDEEDEDEQVVVDEEDEEDEEDENRPEGDEESAKNWPHKGKRPRGRSPKITPQQKKTPRGRPPKIKPQQHTTGNRPKEHRSHKSGGREVLSPAVRRSPRKEGLKQTVKDFARQAQVEGHAEKPSERRSLKLAGRVLDPHVMSSSIESDTSSATHTVRHSPRKNPASATKNSTPRKVVDLDSFDQQPLGKKRKITPEVKERDYTRAANQSRCA